MVPVLGGGGEDVGFALGWAWIFGSARTWAVRVSGGSAISKA